MVETEEGRNKVSEAHKKRLGKHEVGYLHVRSSHLPACQRYIYPDSAYVRKTTGQFPAAASQPVATGHFGW
jgi:hypothetical protein